MATIICYLLFGLTIHLSIYIAIETFLLDISNNSIILRVYYEEITQLDVQLIRRLSFVPIFNLFILLVLMVMYTECVYKYFKLKK